MRLLLFSLLTLHLHLSLLLVRHLLLLVQFASLRDLLLLLLLLRWPHVVYHEAICCCWPEATHQPRSLPLFRLF